MTTTYPAAVVANSSPLHALRASGDHQDSLSDDRRGHSQDSRHNQQSTETVSRDTDVGLRPDCDVQQPYGAHDEGEDNLDIANLANQITERPFAPSPASTLADAVRRPSTSPKGSVVTHDDAIAAHAAGPTRTLSKNRSNPNLQSDPACELQPAVQKLSPGLAARLKALGLGASKKTTPITPLPENIGRLDEEQLRQLDEKHQAGSVSAIISRRGRPWKGAGSFPSFYKSTSQPDPPMPPAATESPQLPEIQASEPLVMDTQKYRLPDHTNGNGTKVTLDTRREHLERTARPPSPEDPSSPPPPPPPPKETPPVASPPVFTSPNDFVPGLNSYFTPGHTRPGSIYTLSRASFANQLAQLTSLQLPDAESLSSKVTAIPTAPVAAKALINAAEQIRSWISKALEVISGLDSEDDVEWAAAGGREGLEEVENAISRFEELINAYVGAIEELQGRSDISTVTSEDLRRAVAQMETIVEEWARIKQILQSVRSQVEIAMEWEELWNNVLGDIQGEMDELSRLVFEMEERRHKSLAVAASGDGVDIGDLETIVEDNPASSARLQAPSRFSLSAALPLSPASPGIPTLSQDDSSLLALFARMQPLRASLDFLPMRLSVFETRAEKSFPTACDELEMRREGLDGSYKKLEKDAESLRKELGEDRWVIVFRGAGRQAQKMHESVERSLIKLKDAVDAGMHLTNQPSITKKMESYEAKKTHYGPAIERVLAIIDKGVKDRLTVNGEILRLHTEMQVRWGSLKRQTQEMDTILEEILAERKSQQLRDSVSSMLSNDASTPGSGRETPGSSPPSSVIMSSLGFDPHTPTAKQKQAGPKSINRRHSSLPTPTARVGQKSVSRLSMIPSSSATTPIPPSTLPRPGSILGNRPRWKNSTNTTDVDTGHNFKPLSLTTPSPYSKSPANHRSVSAISPASVSKLPTFRNPLSRATSESPQTETTRTGHSRLSFRERLASPGPYSQLNSQRPSGNRRATMLPSTSSSTADSQFSRPDSSLSSRRTSLLPQIPRGRKEASRGSSPLPTTLSRLGSRKYSDSGSIDSKDLKPRWRY